MHITGQIQRVNLNKQSSLFWHQQQREELAAAGCAGPGIPAGLKEDPVSRRRSDRRWSGCSLSCSSRGRHAKVLSLSLSRTRNPQTVCFTPPAIYRQAGGGQGYVPPLLIFIYLQTGTQKLSFRSNS
jgi:hypothetical protein